MVRHRDKITPQQYGRILAFGEEHRATAVVREDAPQFQLSHSPPPLSCLANLVRTQVNLLGCDRRCTVAEVTEARAGVDQRRWRVNHPQALRGRPIGQSPPHLDNFRLRRFELNVQSRAG
jgi:hypothetical protein